MSFSMKKGQVGNAMNRALGAAMAISLLGVITHTLAGDFFSSLISTQHSGRLAHAQGVLDESFWPTSLAWSPDGKYLADTSTTSTATHVWDVKAKRLVRVLDPRPDPRMPGPAPSAGFHALAWSPDSHYLAVCMADGFAGPGDFTLRIWDVMSGQPFKDFTVKNGVACESVTFSSDGKWLAAAAQGGGRLEDVAVLSTRSWRVERRWPAFDREAQRFVSISDIKFIPGAHTLAIGGQGLLRDAQGKSIDAGWVWYWDMADPEPKRRIMAYHNDAGYVLGLAVSPSGRVLATGTTTGACGGHSERLGAPVPWHCNGAAVRLWDNATGQLVAAPFDKPDPAKPPGKFDANGTAGGEYGLAFSNDGAYLIAGMHVGATQIQILRGEDFQVVDAVQTGHQVEALAADPSFPRFAAAFGTSIGIWSLGPD